MLLLGLEDEKNDKSLLWEAYFIYDLELMNKIATILGKQIQQQIQEIVDSALPPNLIDKYLNTTYQESAEIVANKLLNYLTQSLDLKSKKNDTFKHGLISDVEAAWVGIEQEYPTVNVLNPLALFYHKSAETKYIQDGMYAGYRVKMSTLDVLNLFGDYLTKEEIDRVQYIVTGKQIGRAHV